MRDRVLKVPTKLAYGVGQIAESIKSNSFEFFLLFYYVQVLHLEPAKAGLALFLALVVDAVTDPLLGSISDGARTRWGRRHPYIYAAAVPFAIGLWLLFSPPASLSGWTLFAWLTFFAIGVRTVMTFFIVPYYALGAELTDNQRERSAIVAYRNMFSFLGSIAVTAAAFQIFFKASAEFPQGQLNPAAYPPFAIAFGIAGMVVILICARGTQSQIPYLHPVGTGARVTDVRAYVAQLLGMLKNPSFLAFFLVSIMFFIILGTQRTLALHMNTYFWELSTKNIQFMLYALFGGTVVCIPFAKYVIEWLDKKRSMYLGLILLLAAFVLPTSLRLLGLFPENDDPLCLPLLLAAQFFAGLCVGLLVVTTGAIVADIADDHEWHTGKRQEGALFGFFNFANKATSGVGHLVAGVALSLISFPTGREVRPGEVEQETLNHLGWVYGPGVFLFGVLSVYVFSFYRITRASHARTMEDLVARRLATVPNLEKVS